ncbi:MAG: outer membrane lipid asymmetry maintenance protein MlaD [Gammaproteobacteria bacterium]|nr:outer membrane lipid asymmetry maintenance protein MlaD [Gammaproteobacteria bacterium]
MKKQHYRYMHVSVGVLMLMGLLAFMFLAMKVSGMSSFIEASQYSVSADFSDIGGLKVRAPVTVAGVKVGEVTHIELQPNDLSAKVTMALRSDKHIPYEDVSARILTEGLLGSNYISIVPGFDSADPQHQYLHAGDVIAKTQEAIILENLIGQLLFNINKK